MKKFNIKVDGVMHEVEVEEVGTYESSSAPKVASSAPISNAPAPVQNSISPKTKVGEGTVVSPLQGTVQSVKVKVGDMVKAGDVIAIVEAMKMENDIPATTSGKVSAIHVSAGAKVSAGDAIIDIS